MSETGSESVFRTRQFGVSSLLGLLAWLAIIFAIAKMTGDMYWTFAIAGATMGLFLANHWASSRFGALGFLFSLPILCLGLASMLPTLRRDGLGAGFDHLVGLFLMGCLHGIVPGILAALMVAIVSASVCEIRGVPVSRFDDGADR